jgi:hypothetical protein
VTRLGIISGFRSFHASIHPSYHRVAKSRSTIDESATGTGTDDHLLKNLIFLRL